MDGFEYALQEIDEALRELIPGLQRRECTPRVMAEADALLDQRNEIIFLMGSVLLEQELEAV